MRRLLIVCGMCSLVGCGARSMLGAASTEPARTDARIPLDAPRADRRGPADAVVSADLIPCACDDGLVWLRGACVPSSRLYTCAASCGREGAPCGERELCDDAAATPSCLASSTRPACVPGPAMALEPGALRIYPTIGPVGQPVTLVFEGGDFYIGALHWQAQIGEHGPLVELLPEASSVRCQARATFPPPGAGIFPVLVTYGGHPVSLAGFYYARPAPIDTIQPGFPCSPAVRCEPAFACGCAEVQPYDCACVDGRCRCEVQR